MGAKAARLFSVHRIHGCAGTAVTQARPYTAIFVALANLSGRHLARLQRWGRWGLTFGE